MKITGAGLAGAAILGAAGCGSGASSGGGESGGGWRRFSGTTINFISENTAPTSAIAANLTLFKNLTGIEVKIQQLELTSLAQRVALDFGSHSGEYHVIYADPYQVLAPLHDGFTDLKTFMDDGSLPSVPKGVGDFIPTQLEAAGHFGDKLFALPYDAPTMIWCYRKDLFEKYHDRMRLGGGGRGDLGLGWQRDSHGSGRKGIRERRADARRGDGARAVSRRSRLRRAFRSFYPRPGGNDRAR